MVKITGNEPAMPMQSVGFDVASKDISFPNGKYDFLVNFKGLTIRQQFAAMAMQAVISNHGNPVNDAEAEYISAICVQMADALINELNKEKP